jgi:hypothetical protein
MPGFVQYPAIISSNCVGNNRKKSDKTSIFLKNPPGDNIGKLPVAVSSLLQRYGVRLNIGIVSVF